MFNNLLLGLVEHGRVETTERKARELRVIAEKAIARATSLGDALLKKPNELDAKTRAKYVHALRLVRRSLKGRDATHRLFSEWAPRYLGRPGGFTRMFKTGSRRGDAASMALVEFVPADLPAGFKPSSGGDEKEPAGKPEKGKVTEKGKVAKAETTKAQAKGKAPAAESKAKKAPAPRKKAKEAEAAK